MGQPVIQTSFNAGEWAPKLNARVDIAKYHSGAALLRNFFVDYRGGATTRPGSKYILQARNQTIRLIPFTASFSVTYMLEFGPGYIRFYNNGSPVLETATSITAAAVGPPEVFTDAGHGYANNDWLFIGGSYYIVQNATTNTFTLTDLFGNAITTNPFSLPAAAQRVYTLFGSPYQAADLQLIKFCQDVNQLFLCHPNYPPQVLTLISATNWTIGAINFAPTIATPTITGHTTSYAAGGQAVSYAVTAVDANGQESAPAYQQYTSLAMAGVNGTNAITINAVTNAVSYNLYRSQIDFSNTAVPAGSAYGFVGNFTTTRLFDTNTNPNFAQTPPIIQNPFSGSGVQNIAITNTGSGLNAVPSVSLTPAPGGGVNATAAASIVTSGTPALVSGGFGYTVGTVLAFNGIAGLTVQVTGISSGAITSIAISSQASPVYSGSVPKTAVTTYVILGSGNGATFNVNWILNSLQLTNPGEGYVSAPAVSFSGSSFTVIPTATTTLGAGTAGNPSAPALVQQRLFLGGPLGAPAQFNMSQPGSPFNFNVSFPVADDDAIQATLTSTTLHSIKSAVAVSAGLVVFSDKAAWLVTGGSSGSAIGATTVVANPQGYSGANDVPPIVTPNDILYVQAKGNVVRDLQYNFYLNNYVGMDVSILSSHLFYGFQILQWAWAEEPFKITWALRNDGQLLSFTFIKDQELLAWAHSDTNGLYTSVASTNEATSIGNVDAVYTAVQRNINGQTLTYIERFVELTYPSDYISSWQVDAGIGYNGSAATTFSGATHLAGAQVTGLADGKVINFTMPVSGTFVFGPGGTAGLTNIANASVVTVGLAFSPQIQTLALDLGGEPTVQSKRKKVTAVTVRCAQALGLSAGKTLATLQPMKDLILGNIGTMSNALVSGLQTTDARIIIDPSWDVFGQYFITQPNPYPASVLGVIPEIVLGDGK